MLVVVSDLHLTDGSTCETINAGAFRQFLRTLAAEAESACWRLKPGHAEGVFEPLERIDVLFLGDILDVMRSEHWLATQKRPWDAPPEFLADVTQITRKILQHNDEAFAMLRAVRNGLPIVATHTQETHIIPIRFHYMVGNHDWFFHLPGAEWNALRQEVINALALSHADAGPFAHTLEESATLAALCREHRVYAQHGDVCDPVNFQAKKGRDAASLGDAIVIELVNGFPDRVRKELDLSRDNQIYRALKESDNIRPLLALPHYFSMVTKHYATPSQRKKLHDMWEDSFSPLLDLSFVRELDTPWKFDAVDGLQFMFSLQQVLPVHTQGQITRLLQRVFGQETYRKHAAKEPLVKTVAVDHVVYGHTHHAEIVPLAVQEKNGNRHQQTYINTGTWRRLHEEAILPGNSFPYVHFHVMTHATFYKDDERFGRRYEMWQGTLS